MRLFKKFAAFLTAMACAMGCSMALQSCSDDDDNIRTPHSIQTGEIPAKNFFLFVDGKFVATNSDIKTEINGSFDPASQTQGSIELKSSAIYEIAPDGHGGLGHFTPTINLTLKKEDGKVALEGGYEPDVHSGEMYSYKVSGEVIVNHAGENDWRIYVERTLRERTNPFVGKTLEIEFSPDDLFIQKDITPQPINDLFAKIIGAYVMNSGVDAARIKFITADTYELSFRNAQSGQYTKDDMEHRYYYMNSEFHFIEDVDFTSSQAAFYNLKAININSTFNSSGFAQQLMTCDMTDTNQYYVTSIFIEKFNELTIGQPIQFGYDCIGIKNVEFFNQWTTPDPIITPGDQELVDVQNSYSNPTPLAVFHEVAE